MNNVFYSRARGVMRIFVTLVCLPVMLRIALQAGLLWSGAIVLKAGTHYVSLDGTNDVANGYITWAGAATQIQWAVSVATNGETVLVSNGTYNLTNQVNILSNITVRSFTEQGHGTNDTIVNGNYPEYTNRCFYITNGAILDGFTISNGYAGIADGGIGGGVFITNAGCLSNCYIYKNYCSNNNTAAAGGGIYSYVGNDTWAFNGTITVFNCSVVSNIAYIGTTLSSSGGGIWNRGRIVASYISGNTAYSAGGIDHVRGLVTNCIVANNLATNYGGILAGYSYVHNCLISNNVARSDYGGFDINVPEGYTILDSIIISNRAYGSYGGGRVGYGEIVSNCQFIGNRSGANAGGVWVDGYWGASVLANCVIRENISGNGDAGVQHSDGTVRNCLIINNTGYGVRSYMQNPARVNTSVVENCTIVNNSAGGLYLYTGTNMIRNCIVYSNTTFDIQVDATGGSNNCYNICISPSGITNLPSGQGNITNNPMFVDWANGNYRLSENSPCINAGRNQNWMTNSYDLDGQTRIRYGTVDMGAYEIIHSGTMYGFH